MRSTSLLFFALLIGVGLLSGCDGVSSSDYGSEDPSFNTNNCTIPSSDLLSGCSGPNCIPSIDDISPGDDRLLDADASQQPSDSARVIGVRVGGRALAVPHSILWTHEIVNVDDWAGLSFAITYCPLTGSSLVFDRSSVSGAELGVSGLLFNNNLVIYDRRDDTSLWPQMQRRATCGSRVGAALSTMPVTEMRWYRWRQLHPDTKVVTDGRGFDRRYPYGDYESNLSSAPLYDMPVDDRRLPKERVLGFPAGSTGGLSVPFRELAERGPVVVVTVAVDGTQKTVFWNREAQAAQAFETSRSFSVENGQIVDAQTGSVWSVDGHAIEGPLADEGARLTPDATAYVAFWFAWAAFQPDTDIWTHED